MSSVTSNIQLNAHDIYQKLDEKDGADSKITRNIWEQFRAQTGVQAKEIKWVIEEKNAIKSIEYYLKIHANDSTILQKIADFCGISVNKPDAEKQKNTPANSSEFKTPSRSFTKENMCTSLQFAGVDVEKLDFNLANKHYDELLKNKPDISDKELTEHMINYANGMIRHDNQEVRFAVQYQKDLHKDGENGVFDASEYSEEELEILNDNEDKNLSFVNQSVLQGKKEGNIEKVAEAFHQEAREYIATYDTNGDGEIDVNEFIKMEENELGRKLTDEEKNKIIEYSCRTITALECYKSDEESNNQLDENEITAYLYAMAYSKGEASETTYEEYKFTHDAIKLCTKPLNTLTEEEKQQRKEFISLLKGGHLNLNKPKVGL